MKKIIVHRATPDIHPELAHLHPLLARVYAARGVAALKDVEHGLEHLLPYAALLGIEQAVELLDQALSQQQHIMVIGDFDADGATSTAVAVAALKMFGANKVSFLVPNRFEYGYGLTPEIVVVAAQQKPDLIITVDNGISSHAGVIKAKELGIKVLITDHHLAAQELPSADAIVNPNQPGDKFPSKNLAGVGVIFYVLLALRSHLRAKDWFIKQNISEPNMAQLLDLVALGTVADVVPLDHNNRILVQQGLARIRAGKARAGIKALLQIAGRSSENLTANDLAFAVAPRLNAAGRLEDMSLGIACLLTEDNNQAHDMAVQLDALNRERQGIEEAMQRQAQDALKQLRLDKELPLGLCLYDENWHQGVVGIVASRIKDQTHRPVIAFAKVNEHELKGSVRSVAGVHIRDVLADINTYYPELITKFGGHAMAAGLTLPLKNYATFCQAFAAEVSKHFNEEMLKGKINSDGELAAEYFNFEVANLLRYAGPWGQGFPEPIFNGEFSILEQRIVGQRHLKMVLGMNDNQQVNAIAFNVDLKNWPNQRCEKVHIAYRMDVNEYKGRKDLQLIVEDLEAV
jgi:single-stranded-DNA-specific exonuclease